MDDKVKLILKYIIFQPIVGIVVYIVTNKFRKNEEDRKNKKDIF